MIDLSELSQILFSFSTHEKLNMLLIFGIVIFGATIGGKIFKKIKIPTVVGFILTGIVIGVSGFNLLTKEMVNTLEPISLFALSLIGFMIGGELKLSQLKKYGKQFVYILFLEAFGAFVFVSIFAGVAAYFILHDIKFAIALGLSLGAISSATDPASTVAVFNENKTRGPLTTTAFGIVAMDDGVALLLFAATTSIAGMLLGKATGGFLTSVFHLFYEIGGAAVVGLLFGWGLYFIIKKIQDDDVILTFSLGAILLLAGTAHLIDVDMILATMFMGFFMANYAPKKTERMFKQIESFSPPIYILFFVFVGAKLNIRHTSTIVLILAVLYVIGRTIGKFVGAISGSLLSKAPKTVTKYLPYCLFSQAGVAIGLSIVAGHAFPEHMANLIVMVVTATTFAVQLIGPPFVKYAALKAGEAGLNITEEDLIKKSHAKELINESTPFVHETDNITKILTIFSEHESLFYPVVNKNDKLIGVISIEDLKNTFMAMELSQFLLAHDIMETPTETCLPDAPAPEVLETMKNERLEYMPVIDKEGKFYGLIENRAIQKHFSQKILELKQKAESLG